MKRTFPVEINALLIDMFIQQLAGTVLFLWPVGGETEVFYRSAHTRLFQPLARKFPWPLFFPHTYPCFFFPFKLLDSSG